MPAAELTAERLREVLRYDAATGLFHRNESSTGRVKPGDVAGGADRNGHIRIYVDGVIYAAHRLAWLYVHGEWPKGVIDHINGARSDNRLANLRDVSQLVNQQNQRKPHKRSTTGLLGVTRARGRYQAQIAINGRQTYIGVFDTPEEAHAAYVSAKRKHHEGCQL